ncbi:alpha/beta fold hydrolase [Nocardia colli]|uniref:Alpha/beta fold hydrolase n=1 Tax=Nocardia colli TaxID=2545717 RepID=A0A5N0E895_9NOCA|nr:alpha/beta fold hydrolase [Nocardia colli]KAA8885638.1 alpha/beta fold hydrolase [Nocardia colli]
MISTRTLRPTSDTTLSMLISAPAKPVAVVVVLPAMGVAANYYKDFTAQLSGHDIAAIVVDLRGQGDSVPKSSRSANWVHADLVDVDLPAALELGGQEFAGLPIFLVGHSFGGHLALQRAARAPEGLTGVVLIASGSVWYRTYDGLIRTRNLVFGQWFGLIARTLGYFPGDRLGFGGRQAAGVMTTWARQVRSGIMTDDGIATGNGVFGFALPLLTVRIERDDLATEAGVRSLAEAAPDAPHTDWIYTSAEAGGRLDHFRWTKHSGPLAARLRSWMNTIVPGIESAPGTTLSERNS